MLDIGWQELFIVAAIALVVVGPKDLPRAIAQMTKVIRKARGMARDFQNGIDDVVREAELDDLRKQVESGKDFNIGKEIKDAVDPDGDFGDQFTDLKSDLENTAKALDTDDLEVHGPPAPEKSGETADATPKAVSDETEPPDATPKEKTEGTPPVTETDSSTKPSAG